MKKTVYTLSVNNYDPEITSISFPLMQAWAKKIGADFHIITERKFPDAPPNYEKLQIYELAKEHKNDWNIFLDADCLVHPDFFDPTVFLQKDTVMFAAFDLAPLRFKTNRYFLRDGRNIGTSNWFAVASDWCVDLWKPYDGDWKDLVGDMRSTSWEKFLGMDDQHLIDDYVLSTNLAKYGLKATTISSIFQKYHTSEHNYKIGNPEDHLFHNYEIPKYQRAEVLKKVKDTWEFRIKNEL